MAEGKWVNIPGKGRRWQQPSGELMMTKPGFGQGEFFQTRASQLLGGASNLLGSMGLGLPGGPQAAGPLGPRGVFGQPPLTGKEKINKAWGTIPGRLHSPQGGGFGYFLGNQPNYSDAQGNMYDAVSGRLLYGAKPRTDSGSISGGSFVGGSSAAERAYQSEASRVAQLTAQDPELQRYEKARQLAVGPGATPQQVQSAEDIGMQMWAKANPELAAKVKPGQAGYEAIQGTLAGNAARTAQGFNMAEQLVPTPQGFPAQIPAFPSGAGYSTGFGVATNLAPGAQTPPPYSGIKPTSELPGTGAAPIGSAATSAFGQPNVLDMEKFQKLLNMVKK